MITDRVRAFGATRQTETRNFSRVSSRRFADPRLVVRSLGVAARRKEPTWPYRVANARTKRPWGDAHHPD